MALETEIQAFNDKLPELLKQHSGRVVVIKGTDVVGVFDNEQAAIEHGARAYGLTPFLVRRVQPKQDIPKAPALTLGYFVAILHFQASSSFRKPDGTDIVLGPQIVIVLRGPVVQVSISISSAFSNQLLANGMPVPPPIIGAALIDTGASVTCIDEVAARNAGFPIIDMVEICSASHASSLKPVFPLQVEIAGSQIKADIDRAAGAELAAQDLLVLIGRDFLSECSLNYNGATGITTLAK